MSISTDGLLLGILGGGRYEGMWGNTRRFVDYDNGTVGGAGLSPTAASKHLQTAINNSKAWDVIYVRGRKTANVDLSIPSADPYYITPQSTTNWSTTYTQYGLQIIGTPIGRGHAAQRQICLTGSSSTAAVMTLKGPYQTLENLGFRKGSSTASAVRILGCTAAAATNAAFQNSILNCTFWKIGSAAVNGALDIESAWQVLVYGCTFRACSVGIMLNSAYSVPQDVVLENLKFIGLPAEVSCDIDIDAAVDILIKDVVADHALPTGGTNKYVRASAASTGLITGFFCGGSDATVATNFTLNGMTYSHCYSLEGLMVAA